MSPFLPPTSTHSCTRPLAPPQITKKKDDKLEALKACALALLEPEKVKQEENWDQMLREVLRLVAM